MKNVKQFLFIHLLIIFNLSLFPQQVTFTDVASSMSINHPVQFIRASVSFFDFDGDGLDDLSFNSNSGYPLFIYKNESLNFTNITSQLGFIDSSRTKHLLWCDYDKDGDNDLFIAINSESTYSRLFRNDAGLLNDVTLQSGIGSVPSSCNAACWGDYNNDGWLDLYVAHYSEYEHNYLYKNNGDGTFSDVTIQAGVADSSNQSALFRLPLAVSFLDYNNDMWQDIYIENDHFTDNTLFKNNGDGTFSDVSEESGANISGFMMGIAIGDYDNNGYLDIYNSNDPFGNYLLKNNGDGTFTECAESLGLAVYKSCWGTNFFDYDNDTDLDLYVCAEVGPSNGMNELFENNGDGTFTRKMGIGLDDDYKSFGTALGDYNNDGYYDIAVNNEQTLPNLYKSSGGSNNWLKLNFDGILSNKEGIGNWIEYFISGNKYVRQTHCGISYMSQNSGTLILGAGSSLIIDSIKVYWAGSGTVDILKNIDVNQTITLTEGATVTNIIEDEGLVTDFVLEQNYPNPFNPSTTIQFSLADDSNVTFQLFNSLGEKVMSIYSGDMIKGNHQLKIDASTISSGVYFYKITAIGNSGKIFNSVKKMVVAK